MRWWLYLKYLLEMMKKKVDLPTANELQLLINNLKIAQPTSLLHASHS